MRLAVGIVCVGGLLAFYVATRGTAPVSAHKTEGEPDAAPLVLTVTIVPGVDAGAPRPQAVKPLPLKKPISEDPKGSTDEEQQQGDRRRIWEAATRYQLRKWLDAEKTTIAVGLLSDMCEQETEIVMAEATAEDTQPRAMLDEARAVRAEAREKVKALSGGVMTDRDFSAITLSDDFIEYCFGVKPNKDGGL